MRSSWLTLMVFLALLSLGDLKLMTGDDVRQKILCKRAALRALDLVQLEAMKIQNIFGIFYFENKKFKFAEIEGEKCAKLV